MDFNFTEEQEILRRTARDFLAKEFPKTLVREMEEDPIGFRADIWKKMAELGWMGLIIPEDYGGVGGDFMDLIVLFEEMGRACFIAPFFSTVICTLPILSAGTEEQKKEFLPKIGRGEMILSLALTEPSATCDPSGITTKALADKDGYVIDGTKLFIHDAQVAHCFLCATRTKTEGSLEDGITLFLVDGRSPGIGIEVIPTVAHDKQCEVRFDGVRVPRDNVLGEVNRGWNIVEFIIQRGSVLKCAEMLGGVEAVLEMTNNYAKERVQFDKPIGSFQAIQHKLAQMLIEVEGLRYLTYEAAWHISTGIPSNLLVSMAKVRANEVYQRTCLDGVKIHGAIGFTKELDLGLYFLRTKSSEFTLGGGGFHRERIACELEQLQPPFLR